MSWLGRLLGRGPTAETPPPPPDPPPAPPNVVLVADDLAASLTATGTALDAAVDAALRAHLAAQELERGRELEGRVPFWLAREGDEAGTGLEDSLRDRLEQRRAAEEGRGSA